MFNFFNLYDCLMSNLFLCIVGPNRPSFSRAGKPMKIGDFVSVVGRVTRVDPTGNNYGPNPTVTVATDAGYTPEVPARNVYSAQGTGTSTVMSRDGKPINVGDAATITGSVNTPSLKARGLKVKT